VTTNILLIADTHLRRGQADRLLTRLTGELISADVILHAGDITDASVLDALATHAADELVHAVRGNNDHGLELPERLTIDVDGCVLAMVHDSGPATGRTGRLRRWFPSADVVVFGHSHLPWHEVDVRESDGHVQHHVNPGSATQRRRAPTCTVAWLVLDDGAVAEVHHVPVSGVPIAG